MGTKAVSTGKSLSAVVIAPPSQEEVRNWLQGKINRKEHFRCSECNVNFTVQRIEALPHKVCNTCYRVGVYCSMSCLWFNDLHHPTECQRNVSMQRKKR